MYYYVLKYQGVEETLYLLLLVAKKNRKNVDTQNNKGKVKIKYCVVVFFLYFRLRSSMHALQR